MAFGVMAGCGSSATSASSTPSKSAGAPASGSASASPCGSLVSDVKTLASTVTSSDKTNQEKADAVKSMGSQISADAKAASGVVQGKLTTLGNNLSALASDLTNGGSADQIKNSLSQVVSSATSAATACIIH